MQDKSIKIKNYIILIVTTAAFSVSVIPGYLLIGSLFEQCAVTFLLSLVLTCVFDKAKINPIQISHSITLMIIIWTIIAIVAQILKHIELNDSSFYWYIIFYYDKPALLYVTSFTAWIYYIIKLIRNADNSSYIENYKKFSRIITITFCVFYTLTLIYCFFLCRSPSVEKSPINLIPFTALKITFLSGKIDYELLFLFLGNIAVFLPLGTALDIILKGKYNWILIFSPIVISTAIESFQYFFRYGYSDIDDIILNVLGFYLGVLFKRMIDKLIVKTTGGKINSFVFF